MLSITGGHRLRVSSDSILERVLASVSSRCTRFSDSASGIARGLECRRAATLCAASAATAAASASVSAACVPCDRGGERSAGIAVQRRQLALDRLDFAGDLGGAFGLLARGVLEGVALGGEIGKRGGQIGEDLLGRVERAVGVRHARVDAAAAAGALARLGADGLFLGGEPRQRRFGVGRHALLALDVGGELHEPQIELGHAVLGARLLAVEVLQGDVEPVQRAPARASASRSSGSPAATCVWRLEASALRLGAARRPRATMWSLACSASATSLFAAVQRR